MPVILHRNIDVNTQISIWKMSETIDDLLDSGLVLPKNIKSNKRKKEWICSRLLLQKISPNASVEYNQYGAPILSNGKAVSISHSHDYCVILISKKIAAIDLELISVKSDRLKSQFISKQEVGHITKSEISTLIWCAKECLFKIHQRGNLIFKKDLIINKIKENFIITLLKNTTYKLHYEKFENYYLVYYFE
tara:strand:+ start:271 stop:846 length:576 start_codon:yes stop_codon:yes gene_type:complete